jgi:site-specific recombinase XerD
METCKKEQWTRIRTGQDDYLTWLEAFLIDRRAQNMTRGTLYFYQKKLELFTRYCDTQAVTHIHQVDAGVMRGFLLWLEGTGHNPGGCHAAYRAVRAFLRWWAEEVEPDNWRNPTQRVKAPKVPMEPIEPISLDDVKALLSTCKRGEFTGERDRAIILALLDTGARASEFCGISLASVNTITGEILIRQGKGRKPRMVYLGKVARRQLRAYLKMRTDDNPALWVTHAGEPLTVYGLNSMMARRARLAGVQRPGLHDFRRAFALNMLREGVDIFSLQKLMGHASTEILRRYLKQTDDDTRRAHELGSPVDKHL